MKSLMVGAMLLRTMNAQIPDINALAALGIGADNGPAPVITPGINAPSEAQLLRPGAAIASLPVLQRSSKLPTGTADVVLDQATSAAPFGAGSTPGTGISFGPNGWSLAEADMVPGANDFTAPVQPAPLLPQLLPAVLPAVTDVANSLPGIGGGFGAFAAPVDPTAPVDPAAPVDPFAPVDPAAPVDPLAPVAPVDPAAPVAAPVAPFDPTAPVAPVDPAAPVDPLAPVAPVDPAAPVAAPVAPFDPTAPVAPVDPAAPVTPFDPAAPVAPIDPAAPIPVDGAAPVAPVDSAAPLPLDPAAPIPVDGAAPVAPVDSAAPLPLDPAAPIPVDGAAPVGTTPVDAQPVLPIGTPIDVTPVPLPAPIETPIDATPVPLPSPIDTPIFNPIDTPIASPIAVIPAPLPVGAAQPIGSNPYVGPYDPNSIYDPNSPYYDPYAQPPGWEGEDNGIYDGEDDDYYQDGKAPVKGPGYDDDEECPAWCLPEDDSYDSYTTSTPDSEYSPYQTTPTPKYPTYTPVADPYPELESTSEYAPYPEPTTYEKAPYPTPVYDAKPQYYPEPEDQSYPQLKKVRSIVRAVRRQVFNWPQPTYSDDDDSGSYDGEDGSIPDWLYDISGAPKRPTPKPQPKCPKSCYKPKSTDYGYGTKPARPTYTKTRKEGYQTTEKPYYTGSTTKGYYSDKTTETPYADYTSSVWYPQGNSSALYLPTGPTNVPDEPTSIPDEPTSVPDEPTSVPSEPTAAPYEPTTLMTQYQAQPYPEQTGGAWSDPGSPAGDYTGDTLDTLCPNTCNPFNPAENFCDITTGCATTGGSKYYCACRAGFRADNYNAKDFSKQFKVAGQPYVYLAVSTSCGTPCSDQTCSEVLERSQCK